MPEPIARGCESSLTDSEAHRATRFVEEAGVDGNDSGEGRGDLFYGLPRRGAAGGDQAKFRFSKINIEGVT